MGCILYFGCITPLLVRHPCTNHNCYHDGTRAYAKPSPPRRRNGKSHRVHNCPGIADNDTKHASVYLTPTRATHYQVHTENCAVSTSEEKATGTLAHRSRLQAWRHPGIRNPLPRPAPPPTTAQWVIASRTSPTAHP